jgi:hypothetical protein
VGLVSRVKPSRDLSIRAGGPRSPAVWPLSNVRRLSLYGLHGAQDVFPPYRDRGRGSRTPWSLTPEPAPMADLRSAARCLSGYSGHPRRTSSSRFALGAGLRCTRRRPFKAAREQPTRTLCVAASPIRHELSGEILFRRKVTEETTPRSGDIGGSVELDHHFIIGDFGFKNEKPAMVEPEAVSHGSRQYESTLLINADCVALAGHLARVPSASTSSKPPPTGTSARPL